AAGPCQQAVLETLAEHLISAFADAIGVSCELNSADQADTADIGHVGQVLQAEQGVLPVVLQLDGFLEQLLALVDLQSCQSRGAGYWVPRIGVAVEELDGAFRAVHKGLLDLI